jgi:hypothetical protein
MSHGDARNLAHGMKEKAAEFQHSGSRYLFQTLMIRLNRAFFIAP